jgi:hypothetical protein
MSDFVIVPRSRASVRMLLERVPEFAAYDRADWRAENAYEVFWTFAAFLCEHLDKGSAPEGLLRRSFDVLSELAESTDLWVQNLVQVNVFEALTDDERRVEIALKSLSPGAARMLRETQEIWAGANRAVWTPTRS